MHDLIKVSTVWSVDAKYKMQVTSVAGISYVQDGRLCSPAATTVVYNGRHT